MTEREQLFNDWAETYGDSMQDTAGFPFEGYLDVLRKLHELANPRTASQVLDLGTGTGALADLFVRSGAQVTGIDFSHEMLKRAQLNVPLATLHQVDLLTDWPDVMKQSSFDLIVSSYVFHEFNDATKLQLLKRLSEEALAPNGQILLGDIAFPDRESHDAAKTRAGQYWDDDEYYWQADDMIARLEAAGFNVQFWPASFCAGIFQISTFPSAVGHSLRN